MKLKNALFTVLLLVCIPLSGQTEEVRPNIVLIFADDLGLRRSELLRRRKNTNTPYRQACRSRAEGLSMPTLPRRYARHHVTGR